MVKEAAEKLWKQEEQRPPHPDLRNQDPELLNKMKTYSWEIVNPHKQVTPYPCSNSPRVKVVRIA